MTQPDPEFDDVDAPDLVAAAGVGGALGVWRARAAGLVHLIVATDSDIGQITPDQGALLAAAERAGGQGAAVVRALDDRTLHARVFFPGVGISEDPGTGSAAGPIGLLARRVWGVEEDLTIRQGDEVRRPCRIVVHAEPGDLRVGGAVAACAEGTFSL